MRSFLTSRISIFLFLFIFLVGSVIALLPTLLSSSWGQQYVTEWINRQIPGHIEAKQLNLQWSGGQTIDGFLLKDTNGNPIIEIEKFSTDATLWQLIKGSARLGYTRLQDLNAFIITDEKGISNLQYALGLEQESSYANIPPSTITLANVNGELDLFSEQKSLSIRLVGNTRQDQLMGSFEVQALFPGLQVEDWSHFEQNAQKFFSIEGSKDVYLQAEVQNFPVDLIDRLVALKRPELNGLFRSTLGNKLNIKLDKEPSSEGLAFNLTLLAPLFQGDLKGKIINNQFSLQDSASFQFQLTPSSINPLVENHFKLHDPARIKFIMEELTFPLSFLEENSVTDPCAISITGHTQLQNQPKINVDSLGDMQLSNLKIDISSPLCSDNIHLQVIGEALQNKQPLAFNFNAVLNKPSHMKDLFKQLQEGSYSTIKISHFPVNSIKALKDQSLLVEQLLGSYADLDVAVKQIDSSQFDVFVSLKTDKITLNQVRLKLGKEISIISPAVIEHVIEPQIANKFLASHDLTLLAPASSTLTISDFHLPLEANKQGIARIELKTDSIQIVHEPSSSQIDLNQLHIKLDGSSFQDIIGQLSAKVNLLNSNNSYALLLGNQGQLSISSHLITDDANQLMLTNLKTHFESTQGSLYLEGNILPNHQLVLTHPLQVQYRLSPQILNALVAEPEFPKLQKDALIYLKADPFQLNLKKLEMNKFIAKGTLSIDALVFQDLSGALLTLDQIDVPWEINSPLNMIRINLKSQAYTNKYPKPSQIAAQFLVSNWFKEGKYDLSALKIEIISNLIGLPTVLASSLMIQEDLSPLFGSILDLELTALIDRNQYTPGYWDMILDSPHFHVKARLKFGEAITLYESTSKAAEIRWTLTPEGYQYLSKLLDKKSEEFILTSPVTLKAFFSDLYIPMKNVKSLWDGAKFNVNFETTDFTWKDPSLPSYKIKGQVHSPNVRDQIDFTVQSGAKDISNLTLNGQILHLFTPNGKKDFQKSDLKLEANAAQLPISLVRALLFLNAAQQDQLKALIGPEMDAKVSVQLHQMEGPIKGSIRGANGEASLDGQLKKGTLILNKPFEAQVRVTPLLSQVILKEYFPLFSSAYGASDPVKIVFDSKGFSLPLIPFNLAQAKIGKGALYLNKVQFRNEGELKNILSLLKPLPGDKFIIWFTPLYFQLAQEQLTLQRMDMFVAQAYSLALWGDLHTGTNKLDLTIGLSEQSLRYAFGFQGIDPNYILQVPIKGRKGKIEIDKKKAIARITALGAQLEGSATSKILGSVLEMATTGSAEGNSPAPTTNPLPWQKDIDIDDKRSTKDEISQTDQKSKKESKSRKKTSEDWLQELLKSIEY